VTCEQFASLLSADVAVLLSDVATFIAFSLCFAADRSDVFYGSFFLITVYIALNSV